MTETTIPTDQPALACDVLMQLIVAFLAPMFLGASGGDINLARMAAIATVNAYTARNQADLLGIAQIIAYGLAALGSLSLSMDDGISLSMTLRLRGNASACTRPAELNRRAIREARPDTQDMAAELVEVKINPASTPNPDTKARQQPAQPAPKLSRPDRELQAARAEAMTDVAAEFTTDLDNLPPAARKEASRRAALLNSCANELLSGVVPPGPRPGALDAILRAATA